MHDPDASCLKKGMRRREPKIPTSYCYASELLQELALRSHFQARKQNIIATRLDQNVYPEIWKPPNSNVADYDLHLFSAYESILVSVYNTNYSSEEAEFGRSIEFIWENENDPSRTRINKL